jgi:hypothetical protein
MTVDRIVGGVEIEHDLLGRRGMQRQKDLDEEVLDVTMPANDLPQSSRRRRSWPVGSALPTNTAKSGSWRRASWSLRSS